MTLQVFLENLSNTVLDSSNWYGILTNILEFIGLYKIFEKCGVKGWWAFVPFARHYKLAQCADREPEGRTFVFVLILSALMNWIISFMDPESNLFLFLSVVALLIAMIELIYDIRIILGLIEVFDRKKAWIIPWIAVPFVAALI